MKNLTAFQLTIYASLIVTLIVTVLLFLFQFLNLVALKPLMWLLLPLVVLITSYFVFSFAVKWYVYRRIKVIYKTIRSSKISTTTTFRDINLNSNIMEETENEVSEWASDRDQEIESLKASESYRRNFIGNVFHELKTPIFNIQGYILTLLEGGLYDDNINITYLQRAAKNIDRLNAIVVDLDYISSLELGNKQLKMTTFNIKDTVKEVFDELEYMFQEKNITPKFKEGMERGVVVKAENKSIQQVLNNLISNAIKYGKEGGEVKVAFYTQDDHILIEIADDGIGISEKHLPHIFERFYRADESRSRQIGGSGLGLAIVKHIIEAHNQKVIVRSTLEIGSTFGFTLQRG